MNKTVFTLLLFLTLHCHFLLLGQRVESIDSLKLALTTPDVSDTTEIHLLLTISMKYQGFQNDSAMAYASASLKKADAIQYTKGRADALLQIGRLKRDQDNAAEALTEMFTALKLYREINDQVQIANALNDISIIYANSGDYEKSLAYFKQALEIFRQMGDSKGESYALNNIGMIYQELNDDAMAKDYFLQSLKIKEKNHDIYGISRGYSNLGLLSENSKQWNEALQYYYKADSLYEKALDVKAQAINLISIARIKKIQGKNNEAKKYVTLALEKGKEVTALSTMLNAYELLSSLEEEKGNFKASLEYQKLYNRTADSLNNENHRSNLEELKTRFNLEEKEREIALLKKDRELQQAVVERKNIVTYGLTAGIVLMVIILALVFYAYRATKSKKDSLTVKNKEIEQQRNDLDKLNKDKDRFFSILSHDLRGPLSSLKGLSHLLTGHLDAFTPQELIQIRTKIDMSLDNLTNLINNILEWSIASSQKRKAKFDKINTLDLIQKNISFYKTIAETKGVTIRHEPQAELFAYADYHAIDTVVRNLLSNSIKFSHPNKEVSIAASRSNGSVLISVKDQGIGIPLDIQNNLFTLTGNVSQPGTNNEKGTGLGLTLCKELMKENHGDIQVKSKPGEGSEFIITIPAHA
ncbi:tetratricopeptide repeat-containing sensor histidine kinase [Chryseolinea sp. H1M3-3]|uniref:tetratricopeptide repeat-containing sensor histidine kinase n=1 Tax=Chryseolinea sp. H1M3-3 TaxID=3034144 RepID=UPI0023EB84D7|nr:tetratricopeptide repeat-containing sensor histidine kinase [Chryseolinea sp. H1M3-3]